MSNPGVIELININLTIGNFRIEDNLGEAIHLHICDFRVDITIKNLESLAVQCKKILNDFISAKNFDCDMLDPLFLLEIAHLLPYLSEISFENIRLVDMLIDTKNRIGLPVYRRLPKSRVLKALNGESNEDDARIQTNDLFQTNNERTLQIHKSIMKNGYPLNNKLIVLFNDQSVIRDGQHRAASIYYLNGDISVPVLRIRFLENKGNVNLLPWIPLLFKWNKKKIIKLLKFIFRNIKRLKYRFFRKINYLKNFQKLKMN